MTNGRARRFNALNYGSPEFDTHTMDLAIMHQGNSRCIAFDRDSIELPDDHAMTYTARILDGDFVASNHSGRTAMAKHDLVTWPRLRQTG